MTVIDTAASRTKIMEICMESRDGCHGFSASACMMKAGRGGEGW
jgi:hypothetical protein